ncbi:MAG: type II toxin-antitoxin system RelE/ParE family toxin [Pseudoxanthomonas sp.]
MRLTFQPLTEDDLESIGDFIALRNPRRAVSFIQEIRAHCRKIVDAPQGYRARPELRDGLRSVPHGNYLIFHLITDDEVRISRVLHAAQDLTDALEEG